MLVLPAEADSIERARQGIDRLVAGLGADDVVRRRVKLAISEAVTNVVLHAYIDAPSAGSVVVRARADDGGLEVEVADQGRGLVPRTDSPGLGWGLRLMQLNATAMRVVGTPGGGTTVRLRFALA